MSAPPAMNPHHDVLGDGFTAVNNNPGGTTIEAKPQLKSFVGDSTRFVPTSLKVRRTVKDAQGRLVQVGGGVSAVSDRPQTYTTKTAARRSCFFWLGLSAMSGVVSPEVERSPFARARQVLFTADVQPSPPQPSMGSNPINAQCIKCHLNSSQMKR